MTRIQLQNRNQRVRRKALKVRLGREAKEREAMVSRKLAFANRETSHYRVKRKVTTCVDRKEKPACDTLCMAITELSEKRKASNICASLKISDTPEKREYKISLKPACDFPYEATTGLSDKCGVSTTCEKCKTFDTREKCEDKNSLQPVYDSQRKANTELSEKCEASSTCEKRKISHLRVNRKDDWQIVINRKNRARREVITCVNHKNKPVCRNFLPSGAKIPEDKLLKAHQASIKARLA